MNELEKTSELLPGSLFLPISGGAAVGDAGLWGDIFQRQQLGHGDEYVPLLLEMGDRLEGGLHGVEVAVVEEDDVAVAGAAVDHVQNFVAVFGAPVLGVHRPVDQGDGEAGGLVVGEQAVGRTYPIVAVAQQLAEEGVVLLQVGQRLGGGELVKGGVVVGVVAHLVALVGDAADDVRVFHRLTAHHEKGGLRAQVAETVQQLRRAAGGRAVVEGEGHVFGRVGGGGSGGGIGAGAGGEQQEQKQRGEQAFHVITDGSICAAAGDMTAAARSKFY